jgi:ADP-ribosylglycohydrolase
VVVVVNPHELDRGIASLTGLALGDALGMPTQTLARARIEELYGSVEGFLPGPAENPVSRGLPAGRVTDDTDQALLLARRLVVDDATVDLVAYVADLLAWERRMEAAGSLDLLGPSTRAALRLAAGGTPLAETGRGGVTNGAAMRVAPVGICTPAPSMALLVARVVHVNLPTHATTVANAGAAAVAAAVSCGIDGGTVAEAVDLAVEAAEHGERVGARIAGASVAARIRLALRIARRRRGGQLDALDGLVGTGLATVQSVPAAFGLLALHPDDPWAGCLAAANLGGDTDTIGAIVGAIAFACHGTIALPPASVAELHDANPVLAEIPALVEALLLIRGRAA